MTDDIEMIKLSGHLNLPKESLCLLSFLMIISKKKIFYYQIVVALPLMDKVITCLAMIWKAFIGPMIPNIFESVFVILILKKDHLLLRLVTFS